MKEPSLRARIEMTSWGGSKGVQKYRVRIWPKQSKGYLGCWLFSRLRLKMKKRRAGKSEKETKKLSFGRLAEGFLMIEGYERE